MKLSSLTLKSLPCRQARCQREFPPRFLEPHQLWLPKNRRTCEYLSIPSCLILFVNKLSVFGLLCRSDLTKRKRNVSYVNLVFEFCRVAWEEMLLDNLLNFAATPKGLLLLQQTGAINECVTYMFSRFTKKLQVT